MIDKPEESYSVEAEAKMQLTVENYGESLKPIGSEDANKNVFYGIRISVGGVRRRLVDLGQIDAPKGPHEIQIMVFNKEHIPIITDQLKEEGHKSSAEGQYIYIPVPAPSRMQLEDIADDVARRYKSALNQLTKVKNDSLQRAKNGLENEYIDQRVFGFASKNIDKHYGVYAGELRKTEIKKRLDILGKYFRAEDEEEKNLLKKLKIEGVPEE